MRPCLALLGLWLLMPVAYAAPEVSATPPAGYHKLVGRGASDTLLSLPLERRTGWMGKVSAVGSSQVTLTLPVALLADEAAPSAASWYYAEFVTGPLAGLAYPVIGNTAEGVFTLQTWGDDLAAHALGSVTSGETGDLVRIRRGWRVADVLGAGESLVLAPPPTLPGAVHLSGDSVLLPDNTTAGVAKKPAATLVYVDSEGWRRVGQIEPLDKSGEPLPPWSPFTLRRHGNTSASITLIGYVPVGPRRVRIPALAADVEMDVAVSWIPAAETPLSASGLAPVFSTATDPLQPHDLLLDINSPTLGFAPALEHVIGLVNGQWREGDENRDNFLLKPGSGYVLRLRGERPVRYWRQGDAE